MRRIAPLVFFIALLAFVFMPSDEIRLDSAVPVGAPAGEAMQSEGEDAPRFTPVPTPIPTPTPVPTPSPTPVPTPVPTPEPTPLVKGMRNDDVTRLQHELINLGFLQGEVDGQYGNATVTAINDVKTYLNEQYLKMATPEPAAIAYFPPEDGAGGLEGQGEGETASAQQTLPYAVNGEADWKLLEAIYSGAISDTFDTLAEGDTGGAVKRVQSRLNTLGYVYKGVDGAFGATTKDALMYFQQLNDLPQTGIADKNTQAMLFSGSAVKSDRPLRDYKIRVDLSEQRVYAYQWDKKTEDYTKLVKKFKCSTGGRGTPTPTGTFDETVRRGEEWHYFKDFGVWAQYAIHIDSTGNIMFHSVLFKKRGGRPTSGSVSSLGRRASHGCIRLAVSDARWMHEHVLDGTTVVIHK
ncbi:peptidoglycan-binding protein [Bacillota bacterium Meth-B3]|nr:L,D-transpeptidase family protein [Christensenellaceae bacterium]MEA5064620.1 L,D-transpeptidase family protein [Eubacteriales bacterium]